MGITAIQTFLTRLQDFGREKGYFEFQQIKEPEDTCCPDAEIEVINFDKTKAKIEEIDLKERVDSVAKFNVTKSCDALKFMPIEERLDFIEYKRWQEFIENNLKPIEGKSNRKDLIVGKNQKYDFSSKIYDSIFLLDFLTRNHVFNMTKVEKSLLPEIPINYIVLVDINLYENPVDFIVITLTLMETMSPNIEHEVAKEIEGELDKIPTGGKWNIQKPKIKNCESIVTFYS